MPVQQQLARPLGLVVLRARRRVGRDVEVAQPDLAVLDDRVGVGDLRLAVAQRLHLACRAARSRLELLDQLELVAGAAVGRDVARRPAFAASAAPSPSPSARRGSSGSPARRSTRPRGGLDPASTARRVTGSPEPHRAARCAGRPAPSRSRSARSARRAGAAPAGSPRRRRRARRRSATKAPAPITPETSPSNSRVPARPRTARARAGRRRRRRRRRARSRSTRARARSSARRPRATSRRARARLPLAERRQQRPVHDQVGVAADRRGEVAVGGAAEAGVADVARRCSGPA